MGSKHFSISVDIRTRIRYEKENYWHEIQHCSQPTEKFANMVQKCTIKNNFGQPVGLRGSNSIPHSSTIFCPLLNVSSSDVQDRPGPEGKACIGPRPDHFLRAWIGLLK